MTDNPVCIAFYFKEVNALAKPILSPIPIFDANEGTTAYFKVASSYDSTLYDAAKKAYQQALTDQQTTLVQIKTRGVETYGNIDNINRPRIVWTAENMSKYQSFVDELKTSGNVISEGDYSTVLGCDTDIGSLRVAYTPLFQNGDELIPLLNAEINNYLSDIKTKATGLTGGLTVANILEADMEGVVETVNGSLITVKKMIAAIEGQKIDGVALAKVDVCAIAGWSEKELKDKYKKTSSYVGWAMHDVQAMVWNAKDNIDEKKAAIDEATTAYEYQIYNSMTNQLVGSGSGLCGDYNSEDGFSYDIKNDSWLLNQSRNYIIRVRTRLSGESNYGDFSDSIILWCKEKPVLSFDGLDSSDENLISSSNILLLLKYQYITIQGETLSTYNYYLYDSNKKLLDSSVTFYGSNLNQFTINGLDNRTVFFVRGTGTTRNGYVLDTGYVQIKTNYYTSAESRTLVQCKNNKRDGYISVTSHLADISGVTTDKITYINTDTGYSVDLSHGEKVTFDIPYQMDFYNAKDYTMVFKVNPVARKNLVEIIFDQDGLIYTGTISTNIRAFTEMSENKSVGVDRFYAMLKITRTKDERIFSDIYFIDSNYIDIPAGYINIWLQHKNSNYTLKVTEVSE